MNSSKLLVTLAAAVSVFGAATHAHAQNTSTEANTRQGTVPQTEAQNQGSTNRSDGSMNRSDGSSTSGMGDRTAPMATDSRGMRYQRDGSSVSSERVARADRN